MLSVCGVNCSTDCRAFGDECAGCNQLAGKAPWTVFIGRQRCPIYDCVHTKQIASCGDCQHAPCDVWSATRNPDMSDKAFEADVQSRLRNLKARTPAE